MDKRLVFAVLLGSSLTGAIAQASSSAWSGRLGAARWSSISATMSHGRLCMEVKDGSAENGAIIQVAQCDASNVSQQWQAYDLLETGEHYHLWSMVSGACMQVQDGSPENGAAIDQDECRGDWSQRWLLKPWSQTGTPGFPGPMTIVNAATGKCLELSSLTVRPGETATLTQAECASPVLLRSARQVWSADGWF
jgi:hypothetical protein